MLLAKGAHLVQLQPSDTDELWMYETFTEKVGGAVQVAMSQLVVVQTG